MSSEFTSGSDTFCGGIGQSVPGGSRTKWHPISANTAGKLRRDIPPFKENYSFAMEEESK